jgi:hypothetical protein
MSHIFTHHIFSYIWINVIWPLKIRTSIATLYRLLLAVAMTMVCKQSVPIATSKCQLWTWLPTKTWLFKELVIEANWLVWNKWKATSFLFPYYTFVCQILQWNYAQIYCNSAEYYLVMVYSWYKWFLKYILYFQMSRLILDE